MRVVKVLAGTVAAVSLTALPAYAQRGNSGNHGPAAPSTSHGSAYDHGPSSTTHGNSGSTHGPSGTSADSAHTTNGKSTTKGDSTKGAGGTTTSKIDFSATPIGQKLTQNTALNSKLTTRLQAEGYKGSVYQSAYGFKNLGQFVAATNVSKNLGISFDQLKLQMTGVKVSPDGTVMKAMVGPDGKIVLVDPSKTTDSTLSPASTRSLGQSIQTLKTGVDSTTAAQTATKQADAEIASTTTNSSTGTAPTTSSTNTKPAKTVASR